MFGVCWRCGNDRFRPTRQLQIIRKGSNNGIVSLADSSGDDKTEGSALASFLSVEVGLSQDAQAVADSETAVAALSSSSQPTDNESTYVAFAIFGGEANNPKIWSVME